MIGGLFCTSSTGLADVLSPTHEHGDVVEWDVEHCRERLGGDGTSDAGNAIEHIMLIGDAPADDARDDLPSLYLQLTDRTGHEARRKCRPHLGLLRIGHAEEVTSADHLLAKLGVLGEVFRALHDVANVGEVADDKSIEVRIEDNAPRTQELTKSRGRILHRRGGCDLESDDRRVVTRHLSASLGVVAPPPTVLFARSRKVRRPASR
jgi:hypothetical protein